MNCENCGVKNAKKYLVQVVEGVEERLLCNACAYHIKSKKI